MSLHIVNGDICEAEQDVIVNAANGIGFMGGILGWYIKFSGVSENINYVTKGKVEREAWAKCLKHYLLGYMPGNVYITRGYELKCKYIFHAVTMWLPGTFSTMKSIKKLLPKIITNSRALGLKSIAMPMLGTGVGHLKPNEIMDVYKEYFEKIEDLEVYVYLYKNLNKKQLHILR